MATINIDNRDKNRSVDDCCKLEWLDANRLGGYASSTILHCNTRRYHGLLVSQLQQPYGKFVLLSKFDDALTYNGKQFPLTTHAYENTVVQGGYPYFEQYDEDTFPSFNFECDEISISKQVLMLKHQNTTLVKYTLNKQPQETGPISITIKPLLAYRDFNSLAKANNYINGKATPVSNGVKFTPYQGMPTIALYSDNLLSFNAEPLWYYNFFYEQEKERGYDFLEDLFMPGTITLTFDNSNEVILACSIENTIETDLAAKWQAAVNERIQWQQKIEANPFTVRLQEQAMEVVVHPYPQTTSVIAGYHWFRQWGRDSMISIPGLTIFSGKAEKCMQTLAYWASHLHQGIIPNRIAPTKNQTDEYDSVDASLWFFWAAQQYLYKTKDLDSIKSHLWEPMKSIIDNYCMGTLYNIHLNDNGLIYAGTPQVKTTWMDVIINGTPLTPRNGMQVEVNALWYNALCFAAEIAKKIKDPYLKKLQPLINAVSANYSEVFWDNKLGYLRDFVNEQEINTQIRPNQIFAVSLPYSAINRKMATQVIAVVKEHLLTPYGLRSLAVTDPNYHGSYFGDQTERDTAYHNGTVWPWLLGAFTEALLKIDSKNNARATLLPCINALQQHVLTDAGLGCVSEIFDGDAPHAARGCIQQAWSIAELIRLIYLLSD